MYSAVSVNGKRLYELARQGIEVQRKPVFVDIYELEILDIAIPLVKMRVVCGKGTYIRALARDIGRALKSGAYLTALRRTRVGEVRVEDCIVYDQFEQWLEENL